MTSTSTLRRLGYAFATAMAAAVLLAHAAAAGNASSYGPPDPWVRYALSLTGASTTSSSPLITDTLAPGGGTAESNKGYTFVTDTLAPGGSIQAQGYRFTTDTLAPGGGTTESNKGYTFVTDTLAPGGGQGGHFSSTRTFSWPDAGIGAGVAVGSIFCLFGGALALVRRRGRLAV
ncbi:MAG TPA: hypothetical protein VNH40_10590 [Gaiellaceae bacterium]|nr:hypothetical protein [Gaiellaceae bacterium]